MLKNMTDLFIYRRETVKTFRLLKLSLMMMIMIVYGPNFRSDNTFHLMQGVELLCQ